MAYYDALITAWNSATQPPSGVTGSGLVVGDTTAQKVAKINAWTVNGPAMPMLVQSTVIYNLIDIAEYTALSAANQAIVNNLLAMGTLDGSPGTNVRSRIVAIFPSGTTTFGKLQNLAKTYDTPQRDWCYANDYSTHGVNGPGNLTVTDANNAGLV
jgi:hypothetical protein